MTEQQQPPLRRTHPSMQAQRGYPPRPAATLQLLPGLWMGLAAAAALLSAGNAVNLLAPALIYGHETRDLADQAAAQDLVNLLLRRYRWGYAAAAGQLTWLALTWLPIMATPFIAHTRGHQSGWAVLGPIGIMLLLAATTLGWLLRATRPTGRPPQPSPPTNV
jgi:hypothetical protein